MTILPRLLIACLVTFAIASAAAADRGHELFAERDADDRGWSDSTMALTMELRTGGGRSVTREVRVLSLEGGDDAGDRILLVFDAPADVAGTALLTHESIEPGNAQQWLYLPAYKRLRRIAATNRSGRFMGTEFTYEDLLGDPLENYSYRYLGSAERDGREVHRIERTPLSEHSAYSRQETLVDPDTLQVIEAVLYDRHGRAAKRFETGDWRQYAGRHWRAHRMVMTDLESGRSTVLTTSAYVLGGGLRETDFQPAALSRNH